MELLNYEVKPFLDFVLSFKLIGRQSRMRMKFIKILTDRLTGIEAERVEIVKQFAKKDESGEFIYDYDERGNQNFVVEDMAGFNKEYSILQFDNCIIESSRETDEIFDIIKNTVLDSQQEYSEQEALVYERWCEIVESE